jgi:hypothetical protein
MVIIVCHCTTSDGLLTLVYINVSPKIKTGGQEVGGLGKVRSSLGWEVGSK